MLKKKSFCIYFSNLNLNQSFSVFALPSLPLKVFLFYTSWKSSSWNHVKSFTTFRSLSTRFLKKPFSNTLSSLETCLFEVNFSSPSLSLPIQKLNNLQVLIYKSQVFVFKLLLPSTLELEGLKMKKNKTFLCWNKFFFYNFSFSSIPFDFKKLPRAFFESSSMSAYPTKAFLHLSNHVVVATYFERSIGQF